MIRNYFLPFLFVIVFSFLLTITTPTKSFDFIAGVDAASQCSPVTFKNGSKISFFDLPATNFPALNQIGVGGQSYQWSYKPCDTTVDVPNAPQQCSSSFLSQTGCYVTFPTMVSGYPKPIRDEYVMIQYTSNSNSLSWTASVYLHCDFSVPETTIVAQNSQYDAAQTGGSKGPIFLTFHFMSKAFCTDESRRKNNNNGNDGNGDGGFEVTWGVVFLIAMFTPLVFYLIIMIAVNCSNGKQGCREICPHFNFWSSLPGLFLDGITFLFSKIRGSHWESRESGEKNYEYSSSGGGREVGVYTDV
jgi:hypothetical protein